MPPEWNAQTRCSLKESEGNILLKSERRIMGQAKGKKKKEK